MKYLPIILMLSTPVYAGGYNQPRIDPPVIEPDCDFFSFTCHIGFDYENPEGGNNLPQSRPEPEQEDDEETCE